MRPTVYLLSTFEGHIEKTNHKYAVTVTGLWNKHLPGTNESKSRNFSTGNKSGTWWCSVHITLKFWAEPDHKLLVLKFPPNAPGNGKSSVLFRAKFAKFKPSRIWCMCAEKFCLLKSYALLLFSAIFHWALSKSIGDLSTTVSKMLLYLLDRVAAVCCLSKLL